MFDTPGRADQVSSQVRQAWNDFISDVYNDLRQRHPGTFLLPTPDGIADGEVVSAVRWAASPAVPLACLNRDEAITRSLCDFGVRGRHVLHNEYCEYLTIHRRDAGGRLRPKRVVMTTELREYWTTLAVVDPDFCRRLAEELAGRALAWSDLYGAGVTDPTRLSADERLRRFSLEVAGDGGGLVTGVPSQPRGKLNTENLLFMTHPINGLDDLIFIVMFGAKPYVVRENGTLRAATKFEIFGDGNPLACRNADPGAALGASEQARLGKKIAFANPLGMYLLTTVKALQGIFFMGENEDPIPAEWIRLSRGASGMCQRLEFGPGDNEPQFLDDIMVSAGAENQRVLGGYDVAKKVEVGPLLQLERRPSVNPVLPVEVEAIPEARQFRCSESSECDDVRALLEEFRRDQT
jgi:hypothetical protein